MFLITSTIFFVVFASVFSKDHAKTGNVCRLAASIRSHTNWLEEIFKRNYNFHVSFNSFCLTRPDWIICIPAFWYWFVQIASKLTGTWEFWTGISLHARATWFSENNNLKCTNVHIAHPCFIIKFSFSPAFQHINYTSMVAFLIKTAWDLTLRSLMCNIPPPYTLPLHFSLCLIRMNQS